MENNKILTISSTIAKAAELWPWSKAYTFKSGGNYFFVLTPLDKIPRTKTDGWTARLLMISPNTRIIVAENFTEKINNLENIEAITLKEYADKAYEILDLLQVEYNEKIKIENSTEAITLYEKIQQFHHWGFRRD
jgi:hypothetical protein